MGKANKRYSVAHIASHDSKINKYRKYLSSTSLDEAISKKQKKIRQNFRKMVRRLMAKQGQNKQSYAISFLNIMASCEELCSLACMPGIPSIENMMSHHLINPLQEPQSQEGLSYYSVTEPLQTQILVAQPEIPIYFVCLVQKVFKLISCPLTKKQNQTVIKGTWNILIKYWKDNGHSLYKVNQKVEWGLLQLLSFKFGAGKKQRFEAEERLRITLNQIQNGLQDKEEEQRSYFCTLELIE